jgi:predicted ATPase
MRIRSFSASNYKSILQLDKFELTDGFNIITGQNAAGKTALLELLSLQFLSKPHRSEKTVPNRGDITNDLSLAHARLEVANAELKRILRNTRQNASIPMPDLKSPLAEQLKISHWDGPAVEKFVSWWLEQPRYAFDLRFNGLGQCLSDGGGHSFAPYQIGRRGDNYVLYSGFSIQLNGDLALTGTQWLAQPSDMGVNISGSLRQLVYRFSPERTVKARSGHGTNAQLAANAGNLPEVLHILQGNAVAFEEFNSLVSEILPQVRWVSIRSISEGNEIIIWNMDKITKRDDLGVPLDETGSGVGQVLAILYVVFTSSEPSTIIVDEPQSFLHPASAVKLIQVLKRYPQHQFILATHSPSIIAAAGPSNLLALTYDGETHMEVFDLQKATSFHAFLNTAGLEIRDTFGADNILWVEGPTEQKAFPEIIERLCKVPLMGTSVVPVSATGDFEGKDATRVFAMYRTLARGNPFLPPALAFILDRETRTQQQINELVTQSNDRAMFLPRRMFENYLLRPAAIAHLMNSIPGFREKSVTEAEVEEKITEKTKDKKLFLPLPVQDDWDKMIHAGNLLEWLFGELSEHRVRYRKTEHSVALARWLLDNHPEDLAEVAEVLTAALKRPA